MGPATVSRAGAGELDCQEPLHLHGLMQGRSSPPQMPTALSSIEKKSKVGKKDLFVWLEDK